eukprot:1657624-Rhodomonas_salina.1
MLTVHNATVGRIHPAALTKINPLFSNKGSQDTEHGHLQALRSCHGIITGMQRDENVKQVVAMEYVDVLQVDSVAEGGWYKQ